ncbi:hypothetical protein BACERE00185_01015 [Bacillus mobilis]|uniref:Uncharacterized protein n=1 Tax=Bacillus mobilis TaxID=2026190 RepID=A0A1Y5Z530_9BACI|nr:hypothetical protein BACERE00185_01015 [Bacillus mobilis]
MKKILQFLILNWKNHLLKKVVFMSILYTNYILVPIYE